MVKAQKIIQYLLVLVSIIMITSCASTSKNTYYQKRKKGSHVNTEQLGRNKYFFSTHYQKKLTSNYKRKR